MFDVIPVANVRGDENQQICVKRESNPQLLLGREPCYHYTINACVEVKLLVIDTFV
jgi:hypothetical protein